jgi:hypothetical protein
MNPPGRNARAGRERPLDPATANQGEGGARLDCSTKRSEAANLVRHGHASARGRPTWFEGGVTLNCCGRHVLHDPGGVRRDPGGVRRDRTGASRPADHDVLDAPSRQPHSRGSAVLRLERSATGDDGRAPLGPRIHARSVAEFVQCRHGEDQVNFRGAHLEDSGAPGAPACSASRRRCPADAPPRLFGRPRHGRCPLAPVRPPSRRDGVWGEEKA